MLALLQRFGIFENARNVLVQVRLFRHFPVHVDRSPRHTKQSRCCTDEDLVEYKTNELCKNDNRMVDKSRPVEQNLDINSTHRPTL